MKNSVSVAFIGFGEVGRTFAGGFRQTPGVSLAAYDVLLADPIRSEAIRAAAGRWTSHSGTAPRRRRRAPTSCFRP